MAVKRGTSKGEMLTGTSRADELYGMGGADRVYANGGNDKVYGGDGNDGLYGQGGDDEIHGGAGMDKLVGDLGNDQLHGDDGNDWMSGGVGDDALFGGTGNDVLRGDAGNDVLDGGAGDDNVAGGDGNDTIIHTARSTDGPVGGAETYDGGAGLDTLVIDVQGSFPVDGTEAGWVGVYVGQDGGSINYLSDPIEGSSLQVGQFRNIETFRLLDASNAMEWSASVDATVIGGNGGDFLEACQGSQDMTGGVGADRFMFRWREGEDGGHDVVRGFSVAEGDRLLWNNMPPDESDDPLTITSVEQDGHTIYTATEIGTGLVVHTVEVDAVGLPAPEFYGIG